MQSFTYGNGQTYTRGYDLDGRISSYTLGATTYSVGYDAASRITSVTGASYGYDSLDRLVQAVLPLTTIAYAYDVNGNRTSAGGNSYAYSGASNRLTSAAGQSITHDANGAITQDGTRQLTYNPDGRLIQATTAQGTTHYQYNPLGQRSRKTGPGIDTVYHYDLDGRLIAESDAAGSERREYIYLGDLPVAVVVIPPAGARTIYYIHADHLNTPRLIADQNQTTVWRNLPATEPFGNSAPEEDPSGLGTFTFNLRFAGQYFDTESGLFYNGFRDYDPATGRYVESDPIGLNGGSYSTYTYVNDNPLRYTDPQGLIAGVDDVVIIGGVLIAGAAMSTPAAQKAMGDAVESAVKSIQKFCQPEDCQEIQRKIDRAIAELRVRYVAMTADKDGTFWNNLFGRLGWFNHQEKYREWQRNLTRNVAQAKSMKCSYNPEADVWLTRNPPDSPAY